MNKKAEPPVNDTVVSLQQEISDVAQDLAGREDELTSAELWKDLGRLSSLCLQLEQAEGKENGKD